MKKSQISIFSISLSLLLILLLLQSCAPVFSEMQTARTLGKNNKEIIPYFSTVFVDGENGSGGVQNHAGLQLAYGINEDLDLRFRYEYIWLKSDISEEHVGTSVLALAPKYSIKKDYVAVSLPIGKALGEGIEVDEAWQIHPGLIFTYPDKTDKWDVSLSAKYIVSLTRDETFSDNYMGINLGAGWKIKSTNWTIRPEYGIAFVPSELNGHISQFSIGASYFID